jgi:hypothetical protein
MKKIKKILAFFISNLLLLFLIPASYAQQPAKETLPFFVRAITQIKTKLSRDSGKESAEIEAKNKVLAEIREKQVELKADQIVLEKDLSKKNYDVQAATANLERFQQSSCESESCTLKMDQAKTRLDNAVRQQAKTEEALRILLQEWIDLSNKSESAKKNLDASVNAAALKSARRAEIAAELEKLYEGWEKNKTKDSEIALNDYVIFSSCEQGIEANPLWMTITEPGAFVYYQSKGERNRNETPHRIDDKSNFQQKVCVGKYFVWSERNGRATSDKNKDYDIDATTSEVRVVEN